MGSPDHIVNYLTFIAEEIRELLAELGFRSLKELVGQTQLLCLKDEVQTHWKAKHLNLEDLLFQPLLKDGSLYFKAKEQEHQLDNRFDQRNLLPVCEELISNGQKAVLTFPIRNTDRTVGTTLGYSISKAFGAEGLPKDTIELVLKGSAGQSLGAFIPKGLSIMLEGDANDYVGKGLSGGTIIIKPGSKWDLAHPHTIIGNTTFFGATSGEAYIRGGAGQRFCVRNSGAYAVVEGVGDHGCEYMTGGRVAVLGPVGKNFAAGMSGGVAYIYAGQDAGDPFDKINHDMVSVEDSLTEQDRFELYQMIEKHYHYTSSPIAGEILRNWSTTFNQFLKVIPLEYKNMTNMIDILHRRGMSASEAELEAFRLKQSNLVLDLIEEAESFSTELKG
jgi:glutamate synthase (NADPH/NADH) large chain